MKKTVKLSLLAISAAFVAYLSTACAFPFPLGAVYTDVTLPAALGNGDIEMNRSGTATCHSILGWVASGDASLNQAALNGKLDHISWANYRAFNILGVYGRYTVEAYGFGSKFGPDETLRPERKAE